jgi:hypothetical protein|tara:strand:- start:14 stop:475 length:462 start_codon:yes stop_codon:yes gene_type:complete
MSRYHQGKFKPLNPGKYMGDPTNIIYRSGWEFKLMRYLDSHSKVLEWGSEELVIPYRSPIDGRMHRYYPDFIVKQINKYDKRETILIEVKPRAQTVPPDVKNIKTATGKASRRYINEVKTWGVNQAKWQAAEEFCKDRGWKFQIMHEVHLGIK